MKVKHPGSMNAPVLITRSQLLKHIHISNLRLPVLSGMISQARSSKKRFWHFLPAYRLSGNECLSGQSLFLHKK